MKKIIVLFLLFMIIININPLKNKKKKNKQKKGKTKIEISNPVKVEIDKAAFDESSFYGVYDKEGNLIINFDRFENKNSVINSVKVLDENKKHIYTISVDDINSIIYIISSDGKRGKITSTAKIDGFEVIVEYDIKFFGKPYDLKYNMENDFTSFACENIIYYEGLPVILKKITGSMDGGVEKEITVNKDYLNDNKLDCGIWILITMLFEELSVENQKKMNNTKSNTMSDDFFND